MEKKYFTPPATYVGCVSINIMDMEQSIEFYSNIIGFKVLDKTPQKTTLTADGETPLLELRKPANPLPKEERRTGLFHFAILLPNRGDLASFLRHMIEERVQLGAADHSVSEALYLSDPDGNGIEVYHDRLGNGWEWAGEHVHMTTDPLDGDGILSESQKKWDELPSDTVMGHIHLHVADMGASQQFYGAGLGFRVMTNYPGALFMATNQYHHHIGLNTWNGENAKIATPDSVGLHRFSLIFPDDLKRKEHLNNLQQQGFKVIEEMDDYMVKDPAGNNILLCTTK